MKINKIEITNFKAFDNKFVIELNNKNLLIYGDNGTGKSSIYEAIKVFVFKNKLTELIPIANTPDEQPIYNNDFWTKYNNKITNNDFEIKINDYLNDASNILENQFFMISIDDVITYDKLELDKLIKKYYFNIEQIENITSKCEEIENEVNGTLIKFHENCKIEIDKDDFTIKIIDNDKGLEYEDEIYKYFNEAKLNLIVLLILFSSIKKCVLEPNKSVLVLDDFITSLDFSNRTFLMKYILENFSDYQIVILTHHISLFNLIKFLVAENNWRIANIYENANEVKINYKDKSIKVEKLQVEFVSIKNDPSKFEEFGNKLRTKSEILLHELSKLLVIGQLEDSTKIIENIEDNKYLYFKNKKNASDLIDEINNILEENNNNNLINRLKDKINDYKLNDFGNLKKIINDLKIYQKTTLNPLSHSTIETTPFTLKEIKETLIILGKLETYIKDFVDKDASSN